MTQEQDKQRAEFEAWMGGANLKRTAFGDYENDFVDGAWTAWQAASAQAVPHGCGQSECDTKSYCSSVMRCTAMDEKRAAAPQPEAQAAPSLAEVFGKFDNYANGFKDGHREARHAAAPVDAKQAVQMHEPWGACVSGRIWIGKLPEHVHKLAAQEGLTIQWLYTEQQVRAMLAAPDLKRENPASSAPAAPVLQPRYRLLVRGVDVIEPTDEFLRGDGVTWSVDPKGVFAGMKYQGDVLLPARRRIDSITGAPNAD